MIFKRKIRQKIFVLHADQSGKNVSVDGFLDTMRPAFSEEMCCVTRIPGLCNGNSISWDPSKLPMRSGDWRINVLTPVNDGAGAAGISLWRLKLLLQIDREVEAEAFWAGDRCFDARWATKSARKEVTETTMIATAASVWSQNIAHAESTWPWLMFPPATLTIAVIAVNILTHRIPQSASFRRKVILTFQSKITGMDMTATFSMHDNVDCGRWDLRKASETMSKVAVALKVPFCLARAAGVTHSTRKTPNQ